MKDSYAVRRGRGSYLIGGLSGLLIGAAVTWAGLTVLTPPQDVLAGRTYTYVEVLEGEVGTSLALNAVAEWDQIPIANNQAHGVVTTINATSGQEMGQGSVLYTTDLRPTVISQGAIPSFRDLGLQSVGPDVGQLQIMLTATGFYKGAINAKFDGATAAAVKSWQKSLSVVPSGVVQMGDIVFVPALPVRVALNPEIISVGASLAGGEDAVRTVASVPSISIPATETQAKAMSTGLRVEISAGNGTLWEAVIGAREAGVNGEVIVHLDGLGDATICGEDCNLIPVDAQTFLASRVITVEPASGLVVPTSAILSKPDGSLVVIDEDAREHEIEVIATAKGMSLIEGVPLGTKARVPASTK